MNTSTPANTPVAAGATIKRSRLPSLILILLVNAVPIVGVLRYGWSATNVLVLYWFENLLIAVCTCIRIAVHRRLTRKRGYWRGGQVGLKSGSKLVKSGLLAEYAIVAFVFTFAHGIFVAAIVSILAQNHPGQPMWAFSWEQVGRGVLVISAMLAVELGADLMTLRARSFAWMVDYVQRRMGRVVILHLAIIFGMLAMAMTESPFGILYVLIGLKTLADLGSLAGPQTTTAPATPAEPPAWALKFADRIGKDKGGAAMFTAKWKKDMETNRRNAIEDEEVMPAR